MLRIRTCLAAIAIVGGSLTSSATFAIEPLPDRVPSFTLGPEVLNNDEAGIGTVIVDLPVEHVVGGRAALYALSGRVGTVVVVRDPECPVSKRYGPRVAELARAYQARGFSFVYVYLNAHLPREALRADMAALGAPGAYIARGGFALADRLGVESTGDVFVLDTQHRLRFRGFAVPLTISTA